MSQSPSSWDKGGKLYSLKDTGDASGIYRLAVMLIDASGNVVVPGGATDTSHLSDIEALLTTIDADTGSVASATGATSDAVVAADAVGTVSAKLRRLTKDLGDVLTSVQLLDNAVSGSELQVDVVGALPAGTATLGQVSATSRTDKVMAGTTEVLPKFASISASSSGDNTIVTSADDGTKIRVLSYVMVCGHTSAMTAQWKDEAGAVLSGAMTLAPDGGGGTAGYNPVGWLEAATNQNLVLNLGTAAQVSGHLTYITL